MSDLNPEDDPEVAQQDEIDAKAEGLVMIARTLGERFRANPKMSPVGS
jgi:hypothetical protein